MNNADRSAIRWECRSLLGKSSFIMSTLLAWTVVIFSGSSSFAEGVWLTDINEARKIAEATNRPILCHFYADWCAPCQKMERQVFPLAQVKEQLQASVVAVKIDTQKQPHLTNRFGVTNLPTDIILEPNGKEILQTTGFHNQQDYVGLVLRGRTRYADLVAARASTPQVPVTDSLMEQVEKTPPPQVAEMMLQGYCPVTLWKSRRWEKGSVQHQVEYKGQLYQLASSDLISEFKQNAERYVPQFLGCDPILVWETDRAVVGDIRFGAYYNERLYLFMNDDNRKRFKSTPDQYLKTQVVLHVEQIERPIK